MLYYIFVFFYTIISFFLLLFFSLTMPRTVKQKGISSLKIYLSFYIINTLLLYFLLSVNHWIIIFINIFLYIGAHLLGIKLRVIGITGHRCSGRTEISMHLERNFNCKVYNLEEMYFNVLSQAPQVKELKKKLNAEMVLNEENNVDTFKLRKIVFLDQKEKKVLDNIAHKVVFRDLLSEILREKIFFNTTHVFIDSYFLMKIPILKLICYPIISICCNNREKLLQRIMAKDKCHLDTADNILCQQLPTESFHNLTEYCIVNDGYLDAAKKKGDQIMEKIKEIKI